MASNETAGDNSSVCQKADIFWKSAEIIHFCSYFIVMPIYAIMGIGGHIVLLVALWKQSKSEQAYAYQIFLIVNETLETVSFVLFSMAFLWGGVEGEGAGWYLSRYSLMWFTAHLAIPLSEWASVNSLLLSVSMAADRAFALGKPFVYKNINHRRHQIAALVASTTVSLLCNLYNVFLFNVGSTDEGQYAIVPNISYLEGALSNGLAYFCDAVRIFGVITLIACNSVVVRMFQARQNRVSKMTGGDQRTNQSKDDRATKLNEKTLVQLTVCQSTFVAISSFSEVSFYTAAYIVPYFNDCEAKLLAPVLNAVLQLSSLATTFTPFLISKQCRIMVSKAIPCWERICTAKTAAVANSSSGIVISVSARPAAES